MDWSLWMHPATIPVTGAVTGTTAIAGEIMSGTAPQVALEETSQPEKESNQV